MSESFGFGDLLISLIGILLMLHAVWPRRDTSPLEQAKDRARQFARWSALLLLFVAGCQDTLTQSRAIDPEPAYAGCGTLGSCGTADLSAIQTPQGWEVTLTIHNTSPTGGSLIQNVSLADLPAGTELVTWRLSGSAAQDYSAFGTATLGFNEIGVNGYSEDESDPITARTSGAVASRCFRTPACAATLPGNTPTDSYALDTVMVYHFLLSDWNPDANIHVAAVDYTTGTFDAFNLASN